MGRGIFHARKRSIFGAYPIECFRGYFVGEKRGEWFMEEIYEKILWEGYGLKLRGATRTRTGLLCRTDAGLRELKKPRGNRENLRFAFDVKEQLRKNGFTHISRFYPALDGEPFYTQDGTLYSLEDTTPAEVLGEEDMASFLRGAQTLGALHHAARGLKSDAAHWDRERLPRLYAKRRAELAKLRHRQEKRHRYDALDLLLLRYDAPFMAQTAEAEALLQAGDYAGAVDAAAEKGAFCHNAYKGESLRLAADGALFIGSFDKCTAELPLADLAAYLRRYMKKTEGAPEGIEKMLQAYEKTMPLSRADFLLLQGMLLYPEKFLRLVNRYYNRRRSCISPAMQERLCRAAEEEKKSAALRDILCAVQG